MRWVDYIKAASYYRRHWERYKRYVEREGLVCQECGGAGEVLEFSDDESDCNCFSPCAWCEGTGLVTRWQRGFWLREKKREKWEATNRKWYWEHVRRPAVLRRLKMEEQGG